MIKKKLIFLILSILLTQCNAMHFQTDATIKQSLLAQLGLGLKNILNININIDPALKNNARQELLAYWHYFDECFLREIKSTIMFIKKDYNNMQNIINTYGNTFYNKENLNQSLQDNQNFLNHMQEIEKDIITKKDIQHLNDALKEKFENFFSTYRSNWIMQIKKGNKKDDEQFKQKFENAINARFKCTNETITEMIEELNTTYNGKVNQQSELKWLEANLKKEKKKYAEIASENKKTREIILENLKNAASEEYSPIKTQGNIKNIFYELGSSALQNIIAFYAIKNKYNLSNKLLNGPKNNLKGENMRLKATKMYCSLEEVFLALNRKDLTEEQQEAILTEYCTKNNKNSIKKKPYWFNNSIIINNPYLPDLMQYHNNNNSNEIEKNIKAYDQFTKNGKKLNIRNNNNPIKCFL